MQIIGKTLGQYRVIEKVGQGGMATVFKAYQPNLDRFVAIKILAPQHAQTPGFKERFFREARAVAMLSHPNILQVYDVGVEDDICYIVMKFVSGRPMRESMGEQMALSKACRYIDQVAGALDHAHESGIVHRDVKSSNLLLEGDWVLITDFGIAKIMEGSGALTCTGEVMGTPAYMSPEQASGKPVNHYTDIYSLGIVLYEMLTGQVPFTGETPYGVMFKHVNDPLPLPRIHRPDLPEQVERVVLKALAKIPEHRYEKAGHLAEALRNSVEIATRAPASRSETALGPIQVQEPAPAQPQVEEESTAEAQTPPETSAPIPEIAVDSARPTPTSNHKILYFTVGILLVSLGIGSTWLYFRPSPQPPPQPEAVLKALSTPAGAQVEVDGAIRGETPLQIKLPLKEHTVRMTLAGYHEWQSNIRFEESKEYPVAVDLKKVVLQAQLKIESYPAGAEVYLDGQPLGNSPLKVELPLGGYTVRATKPGYKDAEQAVDLLESKEVNLLLELAKIEPSPSPPPTSGSSHTEGFFEKGKRFLTSMNYLEALDQFQQGAAQGHAESQNELGYMLKNGLGVPKDLKEAAAWFRKAAAQGHAGAQNNLGILYLKGGPGIQQDDREAFHWFQMAADRGDQDGEFYLANMYRYGRGQAADLNQAVEWYRKAASQGHEGAAQALRTLGK